MTTNAISVAMNASDVTIGLTTQSNCISVETLTTTWFLFDTLNLVRVIVAWLFFVISLAENTFVLWALTKNRADHSIMFHLILSNVVYTCAVMPFDAIWNTTMHWLAGDMVCRLSQMLKQFGMYASSFKVVVVSLDRVTGVLFPLKGERSKRATIMVIVSWSMAFLCAIPAAVIYSATKVETCEKVVFYQCVDFEIIQSKQSRALYYLYTMLMSFLLPLVVTMVSYSLLVLEITNMKRKEKERVPNGFSANRGMQKARKRALFLKCATTLTFLVCWGPYYGKGIYDWFVDHSRAAPPSALSTAMYVMMYLNPVLQPLVLVIFMKQVRDKFAVTTANTGNWLRNAFFKGMMLVTMTNRCCTEQDRSECSEDEVHAIIPSQDSQSFKRIEERHRKKWGTQV